MTTGGIVEGLIGLTQRFGGSTHEYERARKIFRDELGIAEELQDRMYQLGEEYEAATTQMVALDKQYKEYEDELDKLTKITKKHRTDVEKNRISELSTLMSTNRTKYGDADTSRNIANEKIGKISGGRLSGDQVVQASQKSNTKLSSAKKGGGIANALKNFKASGVFFAIDMAIKAIEFGIGKMTEYMRVSFENENRMMQATTTATVNAMSANLASWNNAMSGAYEAQNASMSTVQTTIEASNAMALANKKLANTWTNWIPIIGSINKYTEERMALEQQIAQTEIANDIKRIEATNAYTKQIDEYIEKQDTAIRKFGRSTLMSSSQLQKFERQMYAMGPTFATLNRTIEDALKMQQSFQETSGRMVNFDKNELMVSLAVGNIVGDEELTKFQSQMLIFNHSVSDSANIMYDMANDVTKMGLSQKKVTQSVLNNMKMMNKYQFMGGTKGFIELAKWSENVRFNLSSLSTILDKIQTGGLEGVIKQSAQLQVLGGNFAMYADPLRMAFNAFQNPQELTRNIFNMFRSQGTFNKKTGELEFSTSTQMMIDSAAQTLGITRADAMDMIREEDKKGRVRTQMAKSGLSNDEINAVANKAQYDANTGHYFVTTSKTDAKGNLIKKDVNQVTKDDLNNLVGGTNEEQAVQYAKSTMSFADQIAANTLQISSMLGASTLTDYIQNLQERNKQTLDQFSRNLGTVAETIASSRKAATQEQAKMLEKLKTMNDNYTRSLENFENWEKIAEDQLDIMKEQLAKTKAAEEVETSAKQKKQEARARAQTATTGDEKLEALRDADTQAYVQHSIDAEAAKARGDNLNAWWENMRAHFYAGIHPNQEQKAALAEARAEMEKKAQINTTQDAFATAGGKPMAIAAKNITSIHDGFAQADRRDNAVFAKDGGPFDTLFNKVFQRIDDVWSMTSKQSPIAQAARAFGVSEQMLMHQIAKPGPLKHLEHIYASANSSFNREVPASALEHLAQQPSSNGNTPIRFEPLEIRMNGRLELVGKNGQSVDIVDTLTHDPLALRSLGQLISETISRNIHGGKILYKGGEQRGVYL